MISKRAVLAVLAEKKSIYQHHDLLNAITIKVHSYDKYYARIAAEFCRDILKRIGCSVSIRRLPTEVHRWTVLSSPFVHKTARTQFEKRREIYEVKFYRMKEEGVSLLKWYLSTQSPPTVQIW